jgi:hypothetical protein
MNGFFSFIAALIPLKKGDFSDSNSPFPRGLGGLKSPIAVQSTFFYSMVGENPHIPRLTTINLNLLHP